MKYIAMIVVGGLCCLAGLCLANTVTLVNGTGPEGRPLKIVYQTAYMNKGQKPVFGKRTILTLRDQKRINISSRGYQYAGVVPVSINGHGLHGNNKFAQAQQCSIATNEQNKDATLVITFEQSPAGAGDIKCRYINGAFS